MPRAVRRKPRLPARPIARAATSHMPGSRWRRGQSSPPPGLLARTPWPPAAAAALPVDALQTWRESTREDRTPALPPAPAAPVTDPDSDAAWVSHARRSTAGLRTETRDT